jgi:beta-lactamase class D
MEQVSFLIGALKKELPLSADATDFMTTVMPTYEDVDGHTVIGKTGSESVRCAVYVFGSHADITR